MIRRIGFALAAMAALSACTEIGAPVRSDYYEWRLILPASSGPGLDTLAFHWAQANLPVRVWAEDSLDLPTRMRSAIALWKEQFLYGEFDGTVVSDSGSADVIARVGTAPSSLNSRSIRLAHFATECRGVTILDLSDNRDTLRLPIRVFVDPSLAPGAPGVEECLNLTTAHELGHALGLFEHSDQGGDLMAANPLVSAPSERDRETVELAYHVRATLTQSR